MTQMATPTANRVSKLAPLRLPDFCIIGAAKAGTTTLHAYLCRHPRVLMHDPKEPEFFSRDDLFVRGPRLYARGFAGASNSQVLGEASTTYTRWPHTPDVARRLTQMLPDAKLIYLMRHPVERAFSHYRHHMRFGVTKTFEQALRDDDVFVDCSLYLMQIQRYLRFIPREQLHVVLLDDLKRDPAGVMRGIQRFLGVPERDLVAQGELLANCSTSRHYVRARLRASASRVPGLVRLAERLPRRLKTAVYSGLAATPQGRRLSRHVEVPPMQRQTRRILLERFRQPNAELAAFLGRDLVMWER